MVKNKFGIPCSQLKDKIIDVEINCTSEEEAMALAAGAWFAGKTPSVYMQNSGLCRCIDIILSLYKPYTIQLPRMILSFRRKPNHHFFVSEITETLLHLLEYTNVEMINQ